MKGALITGCPRSGTSVVAALFEAHGAYGGNLGEWPGRGNPNKEHVFFHAANDLALGNDHGSWLFPPDVVRTTIDPGQAQALLAEFDGRVGYLKAPQVCLTYPTLRCYFADWQLICTVRHPASVARSLHNMTLAHPDHGLAVWKRTMQDVLTWDMAYGLNVRYVDYPSLTGVGKALESVGLSYDAAIAQRIVAPDKMHFTPEALPEWAEPLEGLYRYLAGRAAA